VVSAVLGLVAGPSAGRSTAAPATDQLIVYDSFGFETGGSLVPGHVFVELKDVLHPNCKPTPCRHIWGKAPAGNWFFDTGGKIRVDGPTKWTWRIVYNITEAQYNAGFAVLGAEIEHPSRYKLLSTNCVDFAARIASAAGQSLPDYKDGVGVPEPRVLYNTLKGVGNGNQTSGGTVQSNSNPGSTADGTPDPPPPPPCCDARVIIQDAIAEPAKLANQLQVRHRVRDLNPDQINADGTYRVVITNTDSTQNLYSIDWGDGTTSIGELPTPVAPGQVAFNHKYATQPADGLRVFVLENGALNQWNRHLQRPQGSGNQEVDTEQPPPPQLMFS